MFKLFCILPFLMFFSCSADDSAGDELSGVDISREILGIWIPERHCNNPEINDYYWEFQPDNVFFLYDIRGRIYGSYSIEGTDLYLQTIYDDLRKFKILRLSPTRLEVREYGDWRVNMVFTISSECEPIPAEDG